MDHGGAVSNNIAPELQQLTQDSSHILDDINVGAIMGDADEEGGAVVFSDNDPLESESDREDGGEDEVLAAFGDDSDESIEDDDDEEDFMNAIRAANNFNIKKRKTTKKRFVGYKAAKDMDPEVVSLLSHANDLFVANDYDTAEKQYLEVIKKDPKSFSAYKSLGEIYLQQGLKNKSCNAWFLAAHIAPRDGEFWAQVARSSRELGHTTQALYCYGRAIGANHKDFDVMMERATLYRETGQLGRASENFSKTLELYPTKSSVLTELALIYNQLNRTNDAIAMYLKVFEKNVAYRKKLLEGDSDNLKRDFPVFDWSSLNILAELFVNQKNYTIAIRTIKHIARWIQERENEDFWEDISDDSEFDERRYGNAKFESLPDIYKTKIHKLPIDIRIKLGSLRLSLNHIDEALIHYGFLLNDDIADTTDLYHESALKLEEFQLFSDAIKFFQPLSKLEEFQNASIYNSLGKCYTELGKYSRAKESYNRALSYDPENVDIKLALVEVLYYLEEVEESQNLLEHISRNRKSLADTDHEMTDADQVAASTKINDQALIMNRIIRPLKGGSKLTEAEKQAREDRIKQNVIEKYNRLNRLHQGLEAGDLVAAGTWIQLASELIEIFSNVKTFFPKDRSRAFRGIITRSKSQNLDLDSKIQRISDIYEGFTSAQSVVQLSSTTEYQGLKYDQWFQLFMEYALAIAKFENSIDANSIIDHAKNVSVFYQDKAREKIMNLVKLSIAIRTQDQRDILLSLRSVLNSYQFNKNLLRLFFLVQPSGKQATENFISINHQKYFLRQIKGYDSIKIGKPIPGMATIVNKDINPNGKDNVYLMFIYACLLFTNRSYVPSLVYFTRIYRHHKNEPIVTFLSGLAHIHRSMQRSSPNRHLELLQGIKYLMEYYELRTSAKFGKLEEQEALYNVGRAFHLLGLFPIAIEYYNKVLENFPDLDIEEDLKRQAAYNLVLIYNNSGNTKLSNSIMENYLVI
jgi:general transcription factor 3C polypeptide 3 (transcription factor C subunit 4)